MRLAIAFVVVLTSAQPNVTVLPAEDSEKQTLKILLAVTSVNKARITIIQIMVK